MTNEPTTPNFAGLRVLSLESRRAGDVAALISTYGGQPLVAPALREVPLASNTAAVECADRLMRGEFDVVIFLTGVGTRTLVGAIEHKYSRQTFADALARTKVVARGPKPLAVLRELKVPVWVSAPEPNTWHEVLAAIEARSSEQPLSGARVAVQEYGVSNDELLDELRKRGAHVWRVPVYQWALPDDLAPLRGAVNAISEGQVDAVIFTTSVQVVHLWQIVEEMKREGQVRAALARAVVASIGPTTSGELLRHGLNVDLEASHPKFGLLIRELAVRARTLLSAKRA